ncbi:Slp1p Ecym_1081 [Eremothecium cymbalariae DBVPG|uniref:SUN-like protein 1 n=1 Tax=Eremothecium cymbalariae (strain CBS 270.75 / DBVPG 7215 / KCTC 17166 / NRRL Y-17582) TaxID=931890 RepID=G8JMC9_ERECY|nr:hypothetical protein Ecym_1081 [Eremothecium cymbalariae DBVPG\
MKVYNITNGVYLLLVLTLSLALVQVERNGEIFMSTFSESKSSDIVFTTSSGHLHMPSDLVVTEDVILSERSLDPVQLRSCSTVSLRQGTPVISVKGSNNIMENTSIPKLYNTRTNLNLLSTDMSFYVPKLSSVETAGIQTGDALLVSNLSRSEISSGNVVLPSTSVILNESQLTSLKVESPRKPEGHVSDDPEVHNETEFLPFAEWKKLKLDEKQAESHTESQLKTRTMIDYNKVETLGDDMEVDLGIFTSGDDDEPEGKLYQQKFNYASLDCAASIVKTNSEAHGASSILYENKDKYLLNPCSASIKFVVIELCQDILVENIEIANYEFFSSTFKKLKFSVSDRFPVPKNGWKVLGEFIAENSRDLQTFSIPNPMIWAKYLRVDILSHYGDEFYCPISVVRAHGKTMMDEFKMTQKDNEDEDLVVLENEQELTVNSSTMDELLLCNVSTYHEFFDRYNNPLIFPSSDNITLELFWDDISSQCLAALPALKFEEFVKDFNNETANPSKQTKAIDFTPNMPSLSIEESIFKNIMKRISSLEANATLSVLYIEEQSRLLSKSFSSLEKTHAKKLDSLVSAFNETMMGNLEKLSSFARQLRESSVKILEEQKLANDQFTTSTSQRLDMMEKDATFQKRMMYLILFAFSAMLVYVLLTREAYIDDYMEDDGWYLDSPPLKKAKDKLMRKAALAVSTPTIFKNIVDDVEQGKFERTRSLSSSTTSDDSQYLIDNDDDDDSLYVGRGRSYSKLLAADENEVDIDEIMSISSENSDLSNGMDRLLDVDTTALSSRESMDKENK